MNYEEADDAMFEVVKDGLRLFATFKDSAFPQTYRALIGLCAKTNYLKNAMFDMVESDNPYAFKALFRCYCDHYLKFMYLFARFLKERTDAAGVEFYAFCGAQELRDYASAVSVAQGLLGNSVVASIQGTLTKYFPDAAGLSNRQLGAASGKFKYRSILRFLNEEFPRVVSKETPFLTRIVPAYALMSSFVHGGPWSDGDMYSFGKPEVLEECRNDAGVAFLMTASVFLFTAMVVSREYPASAELARRAKAIIDQYASKEADHYA